MSQPNDVHRSIPPHHVAFSAALLTTVSAIIVWIMDTAAPRPVAVDALPFLRVAAAVLWVWFFAERNRHEIGDVRAADDAELHRRGYATGYVDGASGRTPEPKVAQLHSVNGRVELNSGRQ